MLYFWFLLLSSVEVKDTPPVMLEEVEIKLLDGDWISDEEILYQGEGYSGVFRIRGVFNIKEGFEEPAILFSVLGSCDIFWDGDWVGKNGTPAETAQGERPGRFFKILALSKAMAQPGAHQFEMKISNWQAGGKIRFYGAQLAELRSLTQAGRWESITFMSLCGYFTAVGSLFLLFFILVERRETYLVFALLCMSVSCLMALEYMKYFVDYAYYYHFPRLRMIAGFTGLSGLLLVWFFQVRFARKNVWSFALVGFLMLGFILYAPGYDTKSFLIMVTALTACLHIVLGALRRKEKGAGSVLAGLVFCLAPSIFAAWRYMDIYFFLGFSALIVILLIELAIHARSQRKALEETRLQASLLKMELMKKHIQPHFIMNTLTSLVEWIEENPKTGIKMIEALAEEFRILNGIVDETLIPIGQELALCRAHLQVMSHTYNRNLELAVSGVDLDQSIPPGMFHTLLENALTHGDMTADAPTMTISGEVGVNEMRYVVSNPVSGHSVAKKKTGSGLAYVRARLEAGFSNRWELEAGIKDGIWQTAITIGGCS